MKKLMTWAMMGLALFVWLEVRTYGVDGAFGGIFAESHAQVSDTVSETDEDLEFWLAPNSTDKGRREGQVKKSRVTYTDYVRDRVKGHMDTSEERNQQVWQHTN